MKRYFLIALPVLFLAGCGEPKTLKLDRMFTRSIGDTFYVTGTVEDVGNGVVVYSEGDTRFSNVRLKDETDAYSFHFLPSAHPRQPAVGDKVKLLVKGKNAKSIASPVALVVEKFEFQ